MKDNEFNRRKFLKNALVSSAAIAAANVSTPAEALETTNIKSKIKINKNTRPSHSNSKPSEKSGYTFLNLEEAAFVEELVDHMVPEDNLSPKGTELGINIFIDRTLASGWGKGDRLYMQGPWKSGTTSQGYQLPLNPADLFRSGIAAANRHCFKTYSKTFDRLSADQKEEVLVALSSDKIKFENGLPSKTFFEAIYQTVMEGMFSDPIYGGNQNKAGWKMIGFPGVIQNNKQNIVKYRNKKYTFIPVSISDLK